MRDGKQSLCDGWEFCTEWSEDFAAGKTRAEEIRLPHQPVVVPLHYATSAMLRMVCGYRRFLSLPAELFADGKPLKRLFLQFDGAAHTATVFVNGEEVCTHTDGYETFRTEITAKVHEGKDNLIAVRLDTFKDRSGEGGSAVYDDLAYGGLYREVWLDVRGLSCIDDLTVTTRDNQTVVIDLAIDEGDAPCARVDISIRDAEESEVAFSQMAPDEARHTEIPLKHARLWDLQHPYLYTLSCTLRDRDDQAIDTLSVPFGVRNAEFRTDGFYLNRKKVFLRGLNRYQGYPYIGYAAPRRLQEEDARIIKKELKCNAVRIPAGAQSAHFVSACDRLGLLVFTETVAVQYKNHPSVITRDGATTAAGVVNFAMEQDKIIETDGEIFPTKSFDPWEKRQEQAMRHARMLDEALSSGVHAGCFQWSLCDYQTYAGAGSGDRICYHGVLDAFRNPKTAAAVYTAQGEDEVFLSVACPMDPGDYTAGRLGGIYCFTNAEEVTLYRGDDLYGRYAPDRKLWKGLKHPPLLVDISDEEADFSKTPVWQFIATRNGLTKEVTKGPGSVLHLDVRVSHTRLREEDTYDIAQVRVRLLDEHGNLASYAQLPVHFTITGDASLAGPDTVTAEGGMCGTLVRSHAAKGRAVLVVGTEQTESVKIEFETDTKGV